MYRAMITKPLILSLIASTLLISACAGNGESERRVSSTTQLSAGVRALMAEEPGVGLSDSRIRCRRESKGASRLGIRYCSTVDELAGG